MLSWWITNICCRVILFIWGKEKLNYLGDLYTLDLNTLLWAEMIFFEDLKSPRCFFKAKIRPSPGPQ